MFQSPPPTNVLGVKRMYDYPIAQEPPQKKLKTEFAVGYNYTEYFSAFLFLPPELQSQILLCLPLADILASATVSRPWYVSVKRAIKQYCIMHYKLQWSPSVENSLLRVYDESWLKVLKTKKRMFELVKDCNSQQTEGFAWDTELHSMPFDSLGFQHIWNDAFFLMWNESLNYTITSRKPLPSDQIQDICAICSTLGENDETDLILCDGCPKMFHIQCLKFKKVPEGNFFCPECSKYGNKTIPERYFNFTFIRDIKNEAVDTLWASDAEDYSSSDEDEEEIDIDEPDQPIPEEPSDDSGDEEEPYEFEDEDERDWVPEHGRPQPGRNGMVPHMQHPGVMGGVYGNQNPYAPPSQFPSYPSQSYYGQQPSQSYNSPYPQQPQQQQPQQPSVGGYGPNQSQATYPSYPSGQPGSANSTYPSYLQQPKPSPYPPSAPSNAGANSYQTTLLSSPGVSSPFNSSYPGQSLGGHPSGNGSGMIDRRQMDSDDEDSCSESDEINPKQPYQLQHHSQHQHSLQQHQLQQTQVQHPHMQQQQLQQRHQPQPNQSRPPAGHQSQAPNRPFPPAGRQEYYNPQNKGSMYSGLGQMKATPSHWPQPFPEARKPQPKQRPTRRAAHCFPFSRVGKLTGLRKFDRDQIAEVMSVSYGIPLTPEELFELDDDPDAKPDTSTPELRRAFEVIFRFWNKQYGRLSYFPRAPFDLNCGAFWLGNTLESVYYADTSDATVSYCILLDASPPSSKRAQQTTQPNPRQQPQQQQPQQPQPPQPQQSQQPQPLQSLQQPQQQLQQPPQPQHHHQQIHTLLPQLGQMQTHIQAQTQRVQYQPPQTGLLPSQSQIPLQYQLPLGQPTLSQLQDQEQFGSDLPM